MTWVPGTRLAEICGSGAVPGVPLVLLRPLGTLRTQLEEAGVVIAARAPDAGVEAIELPEHPFFIATLFQPQVGAVAEAPGPIAAAAR